MVSERREGAAPPFEDMLDALEHPVSYLLPEWRDGHVFDFRLAWANRYYFRGVRFGAEAKGRLVSELMPQPWLGTVLPRYIAAFTAQHGERFEQDLVHHDQPMRLELNICPTTAGLIVSFADRTARVRAEAELERTDVLVQGVARIQDRYLAEAPLHEICEEILALALELTESSFGVVAQVLESGSEPVCLGVNAMRDRRWDAATCARVAQVLATDGICTRQVETMWGGVLSHGAPLVSESPLDAPEVVQTPAGPVETRVRLGVPIRRGDKLLGLIGVANRSGGYDAAWSRRLEPIAAGVGAIFEAAGQASARRRVEVELRASEERLREAQEIAGLGAWTLDPTTRVMRWSDQAYSIFGLPRTAGSPSLEDVWTRVVEEDRRPLRELYFAVLRDGERRLFDARMRIGEEERHVHVMARGRRDGEGRIVELHGTVQDLTERKQVEMARLRFEQQLAETQRLEALGLLAGGIAHDVNNLLVGVLANAAFIRDELPAEHPVVEVAAEIEVAARRMAELARQVLDYAGRSRVTPSAFDLNPLVDETLQLVRRTLPHSAQVSLALAQEPLVVEADAAQLRQVVMNLVINAGEALGGGPGSITVRTACEIETDGEARVTLTVSDTGVGMNDEQRRRIFDPFYTTKAKGRGLGLSAVHGILRRIGGTIDVESRPLRGSTFRVTLARSVRFPSATPGPARITARADQRRRVLVVDDEQVVRQAVARMLESAGYEAILADGGRQALQHYIEPKQRFDVVLLDVLMPYLSGADVLREIRRLRADQPVIFMSGFEGREEAAANRADAFLRKPFTGEELLAAIDTLPSGTVATSS